MSILNANEIVVRADQNPGQVSFHNFEELKEYMERGLSVYKTNVYTPENIDEAREDLKILKTVKKKLADKQKELVSAYSLPIEEVKNQLDELIGMVKEPISVIEKMIKETEKLAKQKEIIDYAMEKASMLGEYADKVVESKAFFDQRWLNATYKTKDWKADIDGIITNVSDDLETINSVGGKNKGALLGFYFDKLSLDGAQQFMEFASSDAEDVSVSAVDDNDSVVGYKVFKVFGTKRQMLQLETVLEISAMDYDELEDGMPKDMEELTEPDFDSFIAFDIEHTGTFGIDKGDSEPEIIEIGAVKVVNGEIIDKFDMLANPGRKIVPMVARLTHITDEMVASEPSVDDVIRKFKEFAGDCILVGHNIKGCDIPHITRAANRAGISFDNKFLDTKKLAAALKTKKSWKSVKLTDLSACYHIAQTDAHRAWCDAETNAYVYFKLKSEF